MHKTESHVTQMSFYFLMIPRNTISITIEHSMTTFPDLETIDFISNIPLSRSRLLLLFFSPPFFTQMKENSLQTNDLINTQGCFYNLSTNKSFLVLMLWYNTKEYGHILLWHGCMTNHNKETNTWRINWELGQKLDGIP